MRPCLAGFVDELSKAAGVAELAKTVGRGALRGGRAIKDLVTSDAPGKSAVVSGLFSGGLALAANPHDPGTALREGLGFGGGQYLGERAADTVNIGGPTRTGRWARSGMGWLGGALMAKRLHDLAARKAERKAAQRGPDMAERLANLEKEGAAVVLERLREKHRKMRKQAGEAKKQVSFDGVKLKLEYEPGDTRSGVNKATGEKWERKMHCSYGFVPGTKGEGIDGDAIDVYLAKDPVPGSKVYTIKQLKKEGGLDEEKFMLGLGSADEAKKAYMAHMPEWAFGSMTSMSMDAFKKLVGQSERKAA